MCKNKKGKYYGYPGGLFIFNDNCRRLQDQITNYFGMKRIICLVIAFCICFAANTQNDTIVLPKPKTIIGIASFYSSNLDGTKTSTGEIYRNSKMTAASNQINLNTWVKVTNLRNNKVIKVRINDRMHIKMEHKGRVVDLSRTAAKELGFIGRGLTRVKVEELLNAHND